jgi:hypothetical protein
MHKEDRDFGYRPSHAHKNGGYNYRCKSCDTLKTKEQTDRRREMLAEIKDVPCQDCGGSFPSCAMDFDHRDPSEKQFDIGKTVTRAWDKILLEIDKCDIVCANCHRIRTHGCKH